MNFQLGKENDPLIRRIENSISSGRISHAYLIESPSFVDKPAFAREFTKGILCPRQMGTGCGHCPICNKIDHGNHEDLIYVRKPVGKSSVGVDEIRLMQKRVNITPNGERYIVIIEDADLMTEPAQNCLLKTLEEPPGGAVIMLLTDNTEKFLPTIRSRCVKLRIEGSKETHEEELRAKAEGIIDEGLKSGSYYRMRKHLGKIGKDRQRAAVLIDCMEEYCRRLVLSRDGNGIPISPAAIERTVRALEEGRQQLSRGLNSEYVLKRLLLIIGG